MLVDKPAGIFSQAAPGISSLEVVLSAQLKARDNHTGRPFIGLPHRLDRGTSGVMLIARNQRALSRFGQQFQSRKIGKFYLAILDGASADDEFEVPPYWSDYIRKVPNEPRAEVVGKGDSGAKEARLSIEVLQRVGTKLLALIQLDTGRMHQIRVQAASRGLAVVGDPIYGTSCGSLLSKPQSQADSDSASDSSSRNSTSDNGAGNDSSFTSARPIALHALRLEYRHPQNAKRLSCTAPVPDFWNALATGFRDDIKAVVAQSITDAQASWTSRIAKE